MAERRMFAKTIIDSDAFLDMPLSTQALYFHLSVRADDDGFINNPKKIQRMVWCGDDDLKLLIAKSFIIPFESGIVVIKHWKIHNYIRSDRYKPTVYQEEKSQLYLKDNGAYTLDSNNCLPFGIPSDNQLDTQDSIGKDRSVEDRIVKDSTVKKKKPRKTVASVMATVPEGLRETVNDFIEMRKAINKKMTPKALEIMLKKLNDISKGDVELSIKILNQSIEHSWQSVYPLKEEEGGRYDNKGKDTTVPGQNNSDTGGSIEDWNNTGLKFR